MLVIFTIYLSTADAGSIGFLLTLPGVNQIKLKGHKRQKYVICPLCP